VIEEKGSSIACAHRLVGAAIPKPLPMVSYIPVEK
jgi:hypothetical protein